MDLRFRAGLLSKSCQNLEHFPVYRQDLAEADKQQRSALAWTRFAIQSLLPIKAAKVLTSYSSHHALIALLAGDSRATGGKQAQVVRIRNVSAGQYVEVEPQTVRDALNYLKSIPGFGNGVLQRVGTGLAPDTRLQQGQDYVFVPGPISTSS
jgi:hypothetical protein